MPKHFKQLLGAALVLIFVAVLNSEIAHAESVALDRTVTIILDGQQVLFEGTQPGILSDKIFVPVKGFFTQQGWSVEWFGEQEIARMKKDNREILVQVGNPKFNLDGVIMDLGTPAINLDGHVLLPLKAICEAIGITLNWDENTGTMYLETPEYRYLQHEHEEEEPDEPEQKPDEDEEPDEPDDDDDNEEEPEIPCDCTDEHLPLQNQGLRSF